MSNINLFPDLRRARIIIVELSVSINNIWEVKLVKSGNIKGFLAGVLVTVILMSSVSALASTGSKNIEIFYNNIKITLDGKQVTPRDGRGDIVEPFIYNDSIYLPIRAIATALGLSADWDGNTRTAILGTGAVSGDWSKDKPAPIGTKINVDYTLTTSGGWKGAMFVSQVLRGDEAVAQYNPTFFGQNKVGENQEIILVKVQITTAADSPSPWGVGLTQFFSGYSGYNDRLSGAFYGVPSDGDGYVWRGMIVDKTDSQPKLAFETSSVKNVWFALY